MVVYTFFFLVLRHRSVFCAAGSFGRGLFKGGLAEGGVFHTPVRVVPPGWGPPLKKCPIWVSLVSHYSAIGDTISCDAPYSAIGFRGKLFLRYLLVRPVFGLR